MDKLLLFVISFLFVYLIYLITVISKIDKNDKFKKSKQVLFFKNVYKINIEKINLNKFAHLLSLSNSFIIATTVTIIEFFDSLIIKMLVGFVILFPLTLVIYTIIGKIYKSKER